MRVCDEYSYDRFDGSIKNYANQAIIALEALMNVSGNVDETVVRKKNCMDTSKHVFFMNIIELLKPNPNNHYAFFYISLDHESFIQVSDIICKIHGMENPDLETRGSSLKECCNRIGAKLLKFINKTGSNFDIGTPICLPVTDVNSVGESGMKCWPFNFYVVNLFMGSIPFEFGCTILESEEQRVEQAFDTMINIIDENKTVTIEKNQLVSELPKIFDLHFKISFYTGEHLILSISRKYFTNFIILLDSVYSTLEKTREAITNWLLTFANVKQVEVFQDSYPENKSPVTYRVLELTNKTSRLNLALGAEVPLKY